MIEVDQARRLILDKASSLTAVTQPVLRSCGQVLAQDVVSDVDSPPHDKALMDGYALRAEDITASGRQLQVLEEVVAGAVPTRPVEPGSATRIMTGAPLPHGADAVVMVEETELQETASGPQVRILAAQVDAGQNIMRRGQSMCAGDVVLAKGRSVSPLNMGLLAEVGCVEALVYPRPRVGVLATGDELVAAAAEPGPGQIRNSNGPMLESLVERAGGRAVNLGIGRDNYDDLADRIQRGLECEVLVLSGGVSAGVLDLTPRVLANLGVQEAFHKVRLKPGKPLWFGWLSKEGRKHLVFGLPGNPVSSLVCFELFVRPAIGALLGKPGDGLRRGSALLGTPHRQRGDRPTYFPAVARQQAGTAIVDKLNWQGSADLRTVADANCLAIFPAERREFDEREPIDILWLDD